MVGIGFHLEVHEDLKAESITVWMITSLIVESWREENFWFFHVDTVIRESTETTFLWLLVTLKYWDLVFGGSTCPCTNTYRSGISWTLCCSPSLVWHVWETQTKKSRIIKVLSSHLNDKWRKVVVLLREYKNISDTRLEIYTMSLSDIDGMKLLLIISNKYKKYQELLK